MSVKASIVALASFNLIVVACIGPAASPEAPATQSNELSELKERVRALEELVLTPTHIAISPQTPTPSATPVPSQSNELSGLTDRVRRLEDLSLTPAPIAVSALTPTQAPTPIPSPTLVLAPTSIPTAGPGPSSALVPDDILFVSSGTGTANTLSFEVTSAPWMLRWQAGSGGSQLTITALSMSGGQPRNVVVTALSAADDHGETMVYDISGAMYLHVNTGVQIRWQVEVIEVPQGNPIR